VPLLVAGASVKPGGDLGTRATFADVGQTLAEIFEVGSMKAGTSFLQKLLAG
jgi:phosphopentomutase